MSLADTWYPPTHTRQPAGMVYDDWLPWRAYIQTPDAQRQVYAYNVRLAAGDPPDTITGAADRQLWTQLTDKRIDAVGRTGDRYTIYEARRRAGWSAIGQLVGYATLWRLNHPELEIDELVLVTDYIDDAIRAVALNQRIRTWLSSEHT